MGKGLEYDPTSRSGLDSHGNCELNLLKPFSLRPVLKKGLEYGSTTRSGLDSHGNCEVNVFKPVFFKTGFEKRT